MKIIYKYFGLLLILMSLYSCRNCIKGKGDVITESLELSTINSIALNGSFNVYLSQGDTQSVSVTGHENIIDVLEKDVSNAHWDIELDRNCARNFELDVYITLVDISNIELNGSGNLTIYELDNLDNVSITLEGSGDIQGESSITVSNNIILKSDGSGRTDLNINALGLHATHNGSGEISLSGGVTAQSISKSGSGSYKAYSLSTENTTVNSSGSGDTKITANSSLNIALNGSGDVFYKGYPAINSSTNGSGNVQNAN